MELNINSRTIIKIMALIIILLALMSILGQIYKFTIGHERYIVNMFDLDSENNLPTWYSTISLLFCSIILLLIGLVKKNVGDKFYLHWIILSIIFTILSLDENIQLHEQTVRPLRNFSIVPGYSILHGLFQQFYCYFFYFSSFLNF